MTTPFDEDEDEEELDDESEAPEAPAAPQKTLPPPPPGVTFVEPKAKAQTLPPPPPGVTFVGEEREEKPLYAGKPVDYKPETSSPGILATAFSALARPEPKMPIQPQASHGAPVRSFAPLPRDRVSVVPQRPELTEAEQNVGLFKDLAGVIPPSTKVKNEPVVSEAEYAIKHLPPTPGTEPFSETPLTPESKAALARSPKNLSEFRGAPAGRDIETTSGVPQSYREMVEKGVGPAGARIAEVVAGAIGLPPELATAAGQGFETAFSGMGDDWKRAAKDLYGKTGAATVRGLGLGLGEFADTMGSAENLALIGLTGAAARIALVRWGPEVSQAISRLTSAKFSYDIAHGLSTERAAQIGEAIESKDPEKMAEASAGALVDVMFLGSTVKHAVVKPQLPMVTDRRGADFEAMTSGSWARRQEVPQLPREWGAPDVRAAGERNLDRAAPGIAALREPPRPPAGSEFVGTPVIEAPEGRLTTPLDVPITETSPEARLAREAGVAAVPAEPFRGEVFPSQRPEPDAAGDLLRRWRETPPTDLTLRQRAELKKEPPTPEEVEEALRPPPTLEEAEARVQAASEAVRLAGGLSVAPADVRRELNEAVAERDDLRQQVKKAEARVFAAESANDRAQFVKDERGQVLHENVVPRKVRRELEEARAELANLRKKEAPDATQAAPEQPPSQPAEAPRPTGEPVERPQDQAAVAGQEAPSYGQEPGTGGGLPLPERHAAGGLEPAGGERAPGGRVGRGPEAPGLKEPDTYDVAELAAEHRQELAGHREMYYTSGGGKFLDEASRRILDEEAARVATKHGVSKEEFYRALAEGGEGAARRVVAEARRVGRGTDAGRKRAADKAPFDQLDLFKEPRTGDVIHDANQSLESLGLAARPREAGRPPSLREKYGIQEIATRVVTDFRTKGEVSLKGLTVRNPREVAVVAQIARNPLFETFRILAVDASGVIVGERTYTSKLPATVDVGNAGRGFAREVTEIYNWLATVKRASGFHLVHNHPPGDPKPSRADMTLTATFVETIHKSGPHGPFVQPGVPFLGHIVLDHGTFGLISLDAAGRSIMRSVHRLPEGTKQPRVHVEETPEMRAMGMGAERDWGNLRREDSPEEAAMTAYYASEIYQKPGAITLVYLQPTAAPTGEWRPAQREATRITEPQLEQHGELVEGHVAGATGLRQRVVAIETLSKDALTFETAAEIETAIVESMKQSGAVDVAAIHLDGGPLATAQKNGLKRLMERHVLAYARFRDRDGTPITVRSGMPPRDWTPGVPYGEAEPKTSLRVSAEALADTRKGRKMLGLPEEVGSYPLEHGGYIRTKTGEIVRPDGTTVKPGEPGYDHARYPSLYAERLGESSRVEASRRGGEEEMERGRLKILRGAPKDFTTALDDRVLTRKLTSMAKHGRIGQYWYEDSSAHVLDIVGGDKAKAEKYSQLVGIFSPQTPVETNWRAAARAWAQFHEGKPIKSGKTGWMDRAASDLLYRGIDWEGRKTNNFYNNLMAIIDPARVQGSTVDVHIMRAMGYETDSPTSAQYDYAERKLAETAKALGWDAAHQAQAAVWTHQKYLHGGRWKTPYEKWVESGKRGKKPPVTTYDFTHASRENEGRISFEAIPRELEHLSPEQKEAFSREAIGLLDVEAMARKMGLLSSGIETHAGFWDGASNPAFSIRVQMPQPMGSTRKVPPFVIDPATERVMRRFMARIGYAFNQDAVAGGRSFELTDTETPQANEVYARLSRPLTAEETVRFGKALEESPFVGRAWWAPTKDGLRIVMKPEAESDMSLLRGRKRNKERAALRQLFFELMERELPGDVTFDTAARRFYSVLQEKEADANGEGYMDLLRGDEQKEPGLIGLLDRVNEAHRGLVERYAGDAEAAEPERRAAAATERRAGPDEEGQARTEEPGAEQGYSRALKEGSGRVEAERVEEEPRQPEPIYHSAVKRAVEHIEFGSMPGKDLLARLRAVPGIKAEEIEWLGLDEFLKKDRVTKDEALAYIAENEIEIEPHVRTKPPETPGSSWVKAPETPTQKKTRLVFRRTLRKGIADTLAWAAEQKDAEGNPRYKPHEDFNKQTVRAVEEMAKRAAEYLDERHLRRPTEIRETLWNNYTSSRDIDRLRWIKDGVGGSSGDTQIGPQHIPEAHRKKIAEAVETYVTALVTKEAVAEAPTKAPTDIRVGDVKFEGYMHPKPTGTNYAETTLVLKKRPPAPGDRAAMTAHGEAVAKTAEDANAAYEHQKQWLTVRPMAGGWIADFYVPTDAKWSPTREAPADHQEWRDQLQRYHEDWGGGEENQIGIRAEAEKWLFRQVTNQLDSEIPPAPESAKPYTGGHYEPDVIVHFRHDIRKGPSGEKVYHVAEFQSDLHQTGRRLGYRGGAEVEERKRVLDERWDGATKEVGDARNAIEALFGRQRGDEITYDMDRGNRAAAAAMFNPQTPEQRAAAKRYADAKDNLRAIGVERDQTTLSSSPPQTPFKNTGTWVLVAFKKALREAVDAGADKLSWSTGAMNADAYNGLHGRLREAIWQEVPEAGYGKLTVVAEGAGAGRTERIESLESAKNIVGPGVAEVLFDPARAVEDPITGRKMYRVLGQDLADARYKGRKGMELFYDDLLPKEIGKYIKQFNAVVVKADDPKALSFGRVSAVHSITITPEMREAIAGKSQKLFVPRVGEEAGPDTMEVGGRAEVEKRLPEDFDVKEHLRKAQPELYKKIFLTDTPEHAMSAPGGRAVLQKVPVPSAAAIPDAGPAVPDPKWSGRMGRVLLRSRLGEAARRIDKEVEALEEFRKAFDYPDLAKASPELEAIAAGHEKEKPALAKEIRRRAQQIDFINRIETGEKQADPKLDEWAAHFKRAFDLRKEELIAEGMEAARDWHLNYFPRLWKDPGGMKDAVLSILGRSPMEGGKSFAKHRTFPTFLEGLEAGYEPVSWNPVDVALLKMKEMDRYITARRFLADLDGAGLKQFKRIRSKPMPGWRAPKDAIFNVYAPPEVAVKEAFDRKLMDQLKAVAAGLGATVETKTTGMRGKWGLTKGDEVTRRFGGPEFVVTHEIGHLLQDKFKLYEQLTKKLGVKSELKELSTYRFGEETGEGFKKYARTPDEQIANLIHAVVHTPELAKNVAPKALALFKEFAMAHPEVRPLLDVRPSLELGTGEGKVSLGGVLQMGNWVVPEPIADIIDRHLGPSLLGNQPAFQLYRKSANALLMARLGWSGFHLGFTTGDAVLSRVAAAGREASRGNLPGAMTALSHMPKAFAWFKDNPVLKEWYQPGSQGEDMAAIVKAIEMGGGRARQPDLYNLGAWEGFFRGLRQEGKTYPLTHPLRSFGALVEMGSRYVLNSIVPRQKMAIAGELARLELEALQKETGASSLTEAMERTDPARLKDIMARAWDSVDNRLGQVVYENLFLNRTLKDVLHASMQSVGWNLGTVRELGGGAKDVAQLFRPEKDVSGKDLPRVSHRLAYTLALPFFHALVSTMVQLAYTGKPPEDKLDFMFPRTGRMNPDGTPQRMSPATYMKDVYAYLGGFLGEGGSFTRGTRQAATTVLHKLNPILSEIAEVVVKNEDFYGTMIRDETDPWYKQIFDVAKYVAKGFIPYSATGYERLRKGGATPLESAPTFFGLTPAPASVSRSSMQQALIEYQRERMPKASRTHEQAEMSELRKAITSAAHLGDQDALEAAITEARKAEMSEKEIRRLSSSTAALAIEKRFKALPLEEAIRIFKLGTPAERKQMMPYLRNKARNKQGLERLTLAKRVAYLKEAEELLREAAR